jgi:hypothetical protein
MTLASVYSQDLHTGQKLSTRRPTRECEITINEMVVALRTVVFTPVMPCSSLVNKAFGGRVENGQKKFAIGVAINDLAL